MNIPAYISDPQIQFLHQILEEISTGHVLVPRFHRRVVWTDEQRLDLLRSVVQRIPIGSIMLWRTALSVSTYETLGPFALERASKHPYSSYLLDGHQRMATLFGMLWAGTEKKEATDDGICWEAYYDFEAEDFLLATEVAAGDPEEQAHLLPVRILLDTQRRLAFQRRLDSGNAVHMEWSQRADALSEAVQYCKIPIIPLVTDDLERATEALQKINSSRTVMGKADMVYALTYSEGFDFRLKLEEMVAEELEPRGWEELEDRHVLTACRLRLGQDLFEEKIKDLADGIRKSEELPHEAVSDLVRAIDFLAEHCRIHSPKLLPIGSLLPILAYGLQQAEQKGGRLEAEVLVRWFWWQVYVGLAGGSNVSRIRKSASSMDSLVNGENIEEVLPAAWELPSEPGNFDFRHARAKALALRLAEARAQATADESIFKELSRQGADLIHQILPLGLARRKGLARDEAPAAALARSSANRILGTATEVKDLRESLLQGSSGEDLARFVLPSERKLGEVGLQAFLEERRSLLEKLEREFLRKHEILREST